MNGLAGQKPRRGLLAGPGEEGCRGQTEKAFGGLLAGPGEDF